MSGELYRRILPSPPAIDFSSSEGKKLFTEAIHNGTMEGFFKLISYYQTQSEPASCGLASLSMVLNSLAIDPGRQWKGSWRWFDENMLNCCEPLENDKDKGISFERVMYSAQCAGANVEAFRTNQSTINDFRKYVMACSSSDTCHVISSYHRETFNQTGIGHFSPIGGYHAGKDMALILDVARFKYPPHWVPLGLLWEAMDTVDESTGLHRGFMLVSKRPRVPALLYTMSCKHESWISTAKYLTDDVPLLLSSDQLKNAQEVLSTVIMSLPSDFEEFIKWVAEIRRKEDCVQGLSEEEKGRLTIKEEVLKQVQETGLYKHVSDILSSEKIACQMKQIQNHGYSLPNISASKFCQRTCVRCYRAMPITGDNFVNDNREQGVDMLVPLSQRDYINGCGFGSQYSSSNDILTTILLALPLETWDNIKNERVLEEILGLVSTDGLHPLLQGEILHLRGGLLTFKRCKANKVEVVRDLTTSTTITKLSATFYLTTSTIFTAQAKLDTTPYETRTKQTHSFKTFPFLKAINISKQKYFHSILFS